MSVKLTRDCDTILPYGLKTTPFETVFKALQDAAGTVWDVDPTVYRAAIAWAYYLTHDRAPLVGLRDALAVLPAVAVSEAVPLVKDYMDAAQLVELLAQWHEYRPSQAALERLYTAYGMTVDVRPITDPEGQAILPHPVERGAFYVIVRAIEWGRGLTPEELAIVADRATPLGGKPVVVYALTDNRLDVATHARTAGAAQVVWSDEPAEEYVPPEPSEIRGYMNFQGESNIQNITLNNNGTRMVYSATGQVFSFDPGYTFIEAYYLDNGNLVAYESAAAFRLYPDSTYVYIINKMGYSASVAAIDFVKLEPQKAFISQYSHLADWSYTYNDPTLLYDDDGNTIPYDSSKIYTLTCSVKANGTIQSHTRYIEAVNKDGYLGYRSSVSGTACYFYYTVKNLTYYGYMYHNEAVTITTSSSSYVYIYEANGTTVKPYDTTKQYTIIHVWSSSGVLADEYIPQLFITRVAGGTVSDQLHLRMNTGTYSSATIWRVEYIETDLS